MENENEDIIARHKKEKKNLQAKITALKHSVGKNEKKRKKEVGVEIEKMEKELTARHKMELLEMGGEREGDMVNGHDPTPHPPEEENKDTTNNITKDAQEGGEVGEASASGNKKVSKTQKRREKKEAEERERRQRIEKGEEEAKTGVRHRELESLNLVLKERGLRLFDITADGHCLYNAIAHQLIRFDQKIGCLELRDKTASFIRNFPDDFLPFLTDEDTGDMLTEEQFQTYCDKIANTTVWGGQPEIRALSHVLRRPIQILQADASPILIGEELAASDTEPLVITYHRHAFRLGEHYNSTESVPTGETEDIFP